MPNSGSQCYLCDYPVRFDPYRGCSHMCKYCFTQKANKYDLSNIEVFENENSLKKFCEGFRPVKTTWCDWKIPVHIGGVSDPFQPFEAKARVMYRCLEYLAESKYPYIVSTKGRLVAEPEYLNLIQRTNGAIQISAVCDRYDALEKGAPPFAERVKMMSKVAPNCKRLIVRIQPYMHELFKDVFKNLALFKSAGAYGVIVEGMKFFKMKKGLVKVGADFCYPYDVIAGDFLRLKEEAHKLGLAIFAGENRIRAMGDSLSCCGVADLPGFTPNTFNLNHLLNGDKVAPSEQQRQPGTADCFGTIGQTTAKSRGLKTASFANELISYYKQNKADIDTIFGLRR